MRYSEDSHEIKNPADFIRVVSSCIILSLFRMSNEFSKRVMFLGKTKLKIMFTISLGINAFLLLGEFIYRFIIRNNVIILSETHFIPLIISLVGISLILIVVSKTNIFEDMTLEAQLKPEDVNKSESSEPKEMVSEETVKEESPNPPNPEEIEILTIEDEEGDFIQPPPLQEERGNDLLRNILRGKDILELSETLSTTPDDALLDVLSKEDEPDLNDIPQTPIDIQYKIKNNFEEDMFGMDIDDDDDDFIDEEFEFRNYFENINRRYN